MSQTYFVTGTDTDVGKTVASAWLVRQLSADYWKPIQSGIHDGTDTERLCQWAEWPSSRCHPCTYTLREPLSPHASARIDGVEIALSAFALPETDAPLIVEGAGGLLVPLNDTDTVVDLIAQLRIPTILVARSGLGTINHTLLSLAELRRRDIPVAGLIINGPHNAGNREALTQFGHVPVIAEIPPLDPLNGDALDSITAEIAL